MESQFYDFNKRVGSKCLLNCVSSKFSFHFLSHWLKMKYVQFNVNKYLINTRCEIHVAFAYWLIGTTDVYRLDSTVHCSTLHDSGWHNMKGLFLFLPPRQPDNRVICVCFVSVAPGFHFHTSQTLLNHRPPFYMEGLFILLIAVFTLTKSTTTNYPYVVCITVTYSL